MALDLKLHWSVTARHQLFQWYGKVQMHGGHAFGQWICVDTSTGGLVWERKLKRPNTIVGIDQGIIVASEMRSDGPWTADFGVYGISAGTGAVLWSAHREGLLGQICAALDRVPGFTNEIRDAPIGLVDGEVHCRSGRVLNLQTGQCVRRNAEEAQRRTMQISVALQDQRDFTTAHGRLIISTATAEKHHRFDVLMRQAESRRWSFSAEEHGVFVRSNIHSWRVYEDHLLMIVSAEPDTLAVRADQPFIVRSQPTHRELWGIRLEDGVIGLRVPLTLSPVFECRIEDADEQYVLISSDNSRLSCYRRST